MKEALHGVDAVARATEIVGGPGLDAVLNWAGGDYVLKPGGEKDSAGLPEAAKKTTGMF